MGGLERPTLGGWPVGVGAPLPSLQDSVFLASTNVVAHPETVRNCLPCKVGCGCGGAAILAVVSIENVELVRRGLEHFAATGEPAWETIHEDVEVFDHDIMDGREYRGHDDVRRWLFEDWASAWSQYSAEPEEFIDVDDNRVIAVLRVTATGRGSGIETKRRDAIVYVVQDQLVTRLDYYNSREQALEAVAG